MLAASISRLEKPIAASRSKFGADETSGATPSTFWITSSPSVHLLKANLMSNAVGSACSTLAISFVGEPLGLQRRVVDAGRLRQRAVADGIGLDLGDLALAVAEAAQRLRAQRG